ncbi:MAG: hypothetical protein EU536_00915 [Promethearchaeota archaeon]|nr:MAG: hypothetical protein EU536_00915 [Candidatus Lokiarchaeota archaeon]
MGEAKTETENIIKLINGTAKAQKILAAENWDVTFQFQLEGEPEPFFIEIKNGKANLRTGTHPNPTLLIVGDGASIARASRGQGDFTHSISREEVEVKKGKIMEIIRYGRAIAAALR